MRACQNAQSIDIVIIFFLASQWWILSYNFFTRSRQRRKRGNIREPDKGTLFLTQQTANRIDSCDPVNTNASLYLPDLLWNFYFIFFLSLLPYYRITFGLLLCQMHSCVLYNNVFYCIEALQIFSSCVKTNCELPESIFMGQNQPKWNNNNIVLRGKWAI